MPAPQFMFEHYINPLKGWNANLNALDFQGKISSSVQFEVPWGRVMHLNADGEFTTGCHRTGMSLFIWPGSAALNVNNPGSTSNPRLFMHKQVAPAGNIGSLVAKGGYEFSSTEFDTDLEYEPNDLLTAIANDSDSTIGGVLTNERSAGQPVRQYQEPVCGVVSKGVMRNHEQMDMLHFWPEWLPGAFV